MTRRKEIFIIAAILAIAYLAFMIGTSVFMKGMQDVNQPPPKQNQTETEQPIQCKGRAVEVDGYVCLDGIRTPAP